MAILKAAELHVTIDGLHPLPSPRHQRRYEARLPDGRTLELVLPPSPMARLLRSEQSMVNCEAAVVRWILEAFPHEAPLGRAEPSTKELVASSSNPAIHDDPHAEDCGLSELLPKLVRQCPVSRDVSVPCSIFQRNYGTAIAVLSAALTEKERRHVDFQKGRLARRLSNVKSPSGRFGLAASVLSEGQSLNRPGRGHSPAGPGVTRTWTAAFHSMLEGILRDGEDMAVMIAYATIRKHFRRLSHLLDSVMVPRLVIVDGAEHSNVLVTRTRANSDDTQSGTQSQENSATDPEIDSAGGNTRKGGGKKDDNNEGKAAGEEGGKGDDKGSGTRKRSIRITGLRDWSNCVFGDPLFARAFSDDPSEAFLRGFYGLEPTAKLPPDQSKADFPIEDEPNRHTRLLLYQAYHTTVSIVREFYGQRTEKSWVELAARKRLAEILTQLEKIDDEPKRRHRRPSGEMSPAKKVRQSPDTTSP